MTFLGIDLGTSEVKAALVDTDGQLLAAVSEPLTLSHPQPGWSEQEPREWWRAADRAVRGLMLSGHSLKEVSAIGVAGQMHGAVVLDADQRVLRPAILWNDGRSARQCIELESEIPALRSITGNLAMPGFTAPKLRWLRRHEPALFQSIRHVLLPKDWLVLQLCGALSTDLSDASGTLWLEVGARRWSPAMLAACGLTVDHMPELHEGTDVVGYLKPEVARQWGIEGSCVVAAGAGDNAATAVGLGLTEPGDGFVSLGTSGVAFLVTRGFQPNPDQAVHAFCHAVPERWHQMSVMLAAARSLQWGAQTLGYAAVQAMMEAVERVTPNAAAGAPIFLPYLSGERTPHNNPAASAVFFGLRATHDRDVLAYAVAEGVAFAMADCLACIDAAQVAPQGLGVVGGAARSTSLRQLIASSSGISLHPIAHPQHAAAAGAASLARAALTGHLAPGPIRGDEQESLPTRPRSDWTDLLAPRLERFRALYAALRSTFSL